MIKFSKGSRVLALAPHTDDIEICCGGTLAKMIRNGCDVEYVTFSDCKDSVPDGFPKETLREEAKSAAKMLGVHSDSIEILDFKVRYFSDYRQDILQHMIEIRKRFNPQIVLSPSMFDIHQDHHVVAQECLRAFRGSTMLGYEAPWNNIDIRLDFFSEISEEDVVRKLDALSCFESQMNRSYFSSDYIRGLASVRGQQAGLKFAEAFTVNRIISGL